MMTQSQRIFPPSATHPPQATGLLPRRGAHPVSVAATGATMAALHAGLPLDLIGGPTVEISDVSHDLLTLDDMREELTEYAVFRFDKMPGQGGHDDEGKSQPATWERAIRTRVRGMSPGEIARQILRLNQYSATLGDKLKSLNPILQRQVDRAQEHLAPHNPDPMSYHWVLAQERISLTAYFKRVPRANVDILSLYQANRRGALPQYDLTIRRNPGPPPGREFPRGGLVLGSNAGRSGGGGPLPPVPYPGGPRPDDINHALDRSNGGIPTRDTSERYEGNQPARGFLEQHSGREQNPFLKRQSGVPPVPALEGARFYDGARLAGRRGGRDDAWTAQQHVLDKARHPWHRPQPVAHTTEPPTARHAWQMTSPARQRYHHGRGLDDEIMRLSDMTLNDEDGYGTASQDTTSHQRRHRDMEDLTQDGSVLDGDPFGRDTPSRTRDGDRRYRESYSPDSFESDSSLIQRGERRFCNRWWW
ncbi:hypothetical protein GGS23DRAFT_580453 [Durotheca rogersii]|uniref:uncharacterized protein n=1 Tax=Durotheca rogersii TaxID=419775 RepID=UPI0022203465|nr:uncharacterized protein GGS23DRAFT_580453 [Durotheca rogersii]KAI5860520.1 hypothetical protein GGS23DRAFT_580453 [Durotheca rogersii]